MFANLYIFDCCACDDSPFWEGSECVCEIIGLGEGRRCQRLPCPSACLSVKEHKSLYVHRRIWYILLVSAKGLTGKPMLAPQGCAKELKGTRGSSETLQRTLSTGTVCCRDLGKPFRGSRGIFWKWAWCPRTSWSFPQIFWDLNLSLSALPNIHPLPPFKLSAVLLMVYVLYVCMSVYTQSTLYV